MATLAKRPVFRELEVTVDRRRLIVGIHPHGWITVRLKGTRRTVEAKATWLYRYQCGVAVHQARLARRRSRREAAIEHQAKLALEALEAERGTVATREYLEQLLEDLK